MTVPDELRAGAYANFFGVWHSPFEFTLDCMVSQAPRPLDPDDPAAGVVLPLHVLARVKLPAAQIFELMTTLNDAMTGYERLYGEIRRPGEETA